jgi:hypothetical protein
MTEWRPYALPLVALVGLIGSAIALLGALMVLMMSYLVPGCWTNGMHVPLTAAALTIPAAGLLFVPVLIGLPWLYPWVAAPPPHAFQAAWLSPAFFVLRTFGYFLLWSVIAVWARRSWGSPPLMVRAASAGLIVWALTVSLAGVDWIESLNPEFHSSIYGLLFLTLQVVAGLAYGIAMTVLARPHARAVAGYGALLLATLLLWAYMHAMQYIIIWAGNIPKEVTWYLRRETGAWLFVLWGVVLLQFVVPFFAMLSGRVRNRPYPLLLIAGGTLVLRVVESLLFVLPSADARGAVLWLAIPATLAATLGLVGWALQFTLARTAHSPADTRATSVAATAA